MANQTLVVSPNTGTTTTTHDNNLAIVSTSNSTTSPLAALANGGAFGYVYGTFASTSHIGSLLFNFNPATLPANVQVRNIQMTGNVEAGFGATSLPIGFIWKISFWLQTNSYAGNVYAFSQNGTVPTLTGTTATPSGGLDGNGAGTINSPVIDPTTFCTVSVRQSTTSDAFYRGFPEWVAPGSTNATIGYYYNNLPSPFVTGYDILYPAFNPLFGSSSVTTPGFSMGGGALTTQVIDTLLQLGTSTAPIPTQGFNLSTALSLNINYNAPPSAGTVTIGGNSGSVTLTTVVPTINWVYTDPENDPQSGFVIIVWPAGTNASTPLHANNGFSIEYNAVQPVWCSGLQTINTNSFTLPTGALLPGNSYVIQVLVTDAGSRTRYSDYSAGLINVTIPGSIGILLAPGFTPQLATNATFNPSTGQITLPVKGRINLLNNADAIFTTVVGTVVNGATAALSPGERITASAAAMAWTGDTVGAFGGDLYTATLDLTAPSGRTLNLSLTFNNVNGTSTTITRTNNGSGLAGRAWVMGWAPSGTVSATISLAVPNSVNTDVYTMTQCAVTNGLINLLDNSDFSLRTQLWTLTTSGAGNGAITSPDPLTPTNGFTLGSNFYSVFNPANADTAFIAPTLIPDLHGSTFNISALANSPNALGVTFKVTNQSATLLVPSATVTPTANQWNQLAQTVTGTGMASTDYGLAAFGVGTVGAAGSNLLILNDQANHAGGSTSVGSWNPVSANTLVTWGAPDGSTWGIELTYPANVTPPVNYVAVTQKYTITGGQAYTATSQVIGFIWNGSVYTTTAAPTPASTLAFLFYDISGNLIETFVGPLNSAAHPTVSAFAPLNAVSVALELSTTSGNPALYTSGNALGIVVGSFFTLLSSADAVEFGSFALTPNWPLTNQALTAGTLTAALPASLALGAASNTVGWAAEVGSAIWDNAHLYLSATQSIKLAANSQVSQLFTCAGYTQLAINMPYFQTTGTTSLTVTFYDPAGTLLWFQQAGVWTQGWSYVGAALSSFTLSPTQTIPVPVGTAFCKITFGSSGGSWVGPLTFTPTGTLGPMPYLNGGWSEGASNALPGNVLQRSVDHGATWQTLRYGPNSVQASVPFLQNTGSASLQAAALLNYTDIEYPGGTTPLYRTYTVLNGQSYIVSGNPGSSVPFTPGQVTDIWLIDLLSPGDSVKLNVKSLKMSTTQNLSRYNGLGRKRVVVLGDVVQGDVITAELFSFTAVDFAAYMKQIKKASTLLLRTPDGEQWYVQFTKRDRTRTWTGNYSSQLRSYTLELQEVDPLP